MDTLLVNGRIWTGEDNPSSERISAAVIRSGRILELGETETIRSEYSGFPRWTSAAGRWCRA